MPILFSGPMVSAIQEDRKTQTRRVMIPQPKRGHREWRFPHPGLGFSNSHLLACGDSHAGAMIPYCRYGQVGDILIVKETHYRWGKWARNGLTKKGRPAWRFKSVQWTGESNGIRFCVNETRPFEPTTQRTKLGWHKRPSIFMPLKAARLRLELTNVRVERLKEITEADAKAEGAELTQTVRGLKTWAASYRAAYQSLWDSINARRDGDQFAWDKNPWVFALTFKKL